MKRPIRMFMTAFALVTSMFAFAAGIADSDLPVECCITSGPDRGL